MTRPAVTSPSTPGAPAPAVPGETGPRKTGPRETGPDEAAAGRTIPAQTTAAQTTAREAAPGRTTAGGTGPREQYRMFVEALPDVCSGDPARMVFAADAGGRCEVFAWDAATARARQVTDRALGTLHGTIDPAGRVWWFDEDADGVGVWRLQPFEGGPDSPGLTGVTPGRPRGLSVSADGTVVMGMGQTDTTVVLTGEPGGPAREIAALHRYASVSGIAGTGRDALVVVTGSARSPHAVTVLGTDGEVRAVLPGTGGALWSLGFSPGTAPGSAYPELLLVRETASGYALAGWCPDTGLRTYPWCSFDTEITACWYPEGRSVLVRQDRHGRSRLDRADLDTGVLTRVPAPPGTLLDAAPRPGGDLHYLWTDTAHPPRTVSTAGTALPMSGPPPDRAPEPGEDDDVWTPVPGTHRDLWTPGPGGPVHTWLSLPEVPPGREGTRPPVVFLVHGGPADHDRDAYGGVVHSLVGAGLAVARVNYRGSTGYGPRWRAAFDEGVGHTQLADLAAVRADLIARDLVRPDAVGLWGTSWGGYLTLLALGADPLLWQAGVAVKPVADSVAAYRTTTGALRALDERLYGGTPDEVPEAYLRSSPIRYAAQVRAPLLVIAATRDVKCPPGQVRSYLAALSAAGVPHESMWLDTGHNGYDGADHAALIRRSVLFLLRELRGPRRPTTPPADGRGATDRNPARDAAPAVAPPTGTRR